MIDVRELARDERAGKELEDAQRHPFVVTPVEARDFNVHRDSTTGFVRLQCSAESFRALMTVVNLSHFIPDELYSSKGHIPKAQVEEYMEALHELATVMGLMPEGTLQVPDDGTG